MPSFTSDTNKLEWDEQKRPASFHSSRSNKVEISSDIPPSDHLRTVLSDGYKDAIALIFDKYEHRLAMPLVILAFVVNASISRVFPLAHSLEHSTSVGHRVGKDLPAYGPTRLKSRTLCSGSTNKFRIWQEAYRFLACMRGCLHRFVLFSLLPVHRNLGEKESQLLATTEYSARAVGR